MRCHPSSAWRAAASEVGVMSKDLGNAAFPPSTSLRYIRVAARRPALTTHFVVAGRVPEERSGGGVSRPATHNGRYDGARHGATQGRRATARAGGGRGRP